MGRVTRIFSRIRIDNEGELIDRWPGEFYRDRAAPTF